MIRLEMKSCNMILKHRGCKNISNRAIEQAKFTDSSFGKAFEKQTKTIKDQGKNKLKL